jgi:exosome complex RNA-binding protein Csl4
VRLGPSTPGDYVRARVLVPQNPGVTRGYHKPTGTPGDYVRARVLVPQNPGVTRGYHKPTGT